VRSARSRVARGGLPERLGYEAFSRLEGRVTRDRSDGSVGAGRGGRRGSREREKTRTREEVVKAARGVDDFIHQGPG